MGKIAIGLAGTGGLLVLGAMALPMLGYDFTRLARDERALPMAAPVDGLDYAFGSGPEWLTSGGRLHGIGPMERLEYDLAGLESAPIRRTMVFPAVTGL